MQTSYKFNRNQLIALCSVTLLVPALRLVPSLTASLGGRAAWLSVPAAALPLLGYVWFLSRFMSHRKSGEGMAELTLRCLGSGAGGAALLALSGISDTADGYIARRFNMVSDLGKIIDPVADKLTQAAMLLCLLTRYPLMLLPLLLLTFKEISTGIMSLIVIRKTGLVMSADWHGKVTTGLLYAMMLISSGTASRCRFQMR